MTPKQHNSQHQSQTSEATTPAYEGSGSESGFEDIADEDKRMDTERKSTPISLSASSSGRREKDYGQEKHPSSATNFQQQIRHGNASSNPHISQRPHISQSQSESQNLNLPLVQVPPCLVIQEAIPLLDSTSLQPPVTTETLQELDLHWMQNNIDLRVDINYNPELHFMPISGQRGEQKHAENNRYWQCLELELCVYQHNARRGCPACQVQVQHSSTPVVTFAPRLWRMFEALRKILLTLVPECERDEIEQTIDADLLMQQVRNDVLDIMRLSNWLKRLLTAHCAPVRDKLAEQMSTLLCEGAHQGNTAIIIAGLAKLFDLCEAMKLDVSNHQIRSFRAPLITGGISFQRDYFSTRLRSHKLDIRPSHKWFACHEECLAAKTDGILEGTDVLVEGLVELCTDASLAIPTTLKYDTMRIRQIQEEISDIVFLGICINVFEDASRRFASTKTNLSAYHGILKTRIMDLTDAQAECEEDSATDVWQGSTEVISLEIARAVTKLARRAPDPNIQLYVAAELAKAFRAEQSNQEHVSILAKDLKQRTSSHVTVFRKMSALDISEAQRHHRQSRQPKSSVLRQLPDADDIARRLAHVIIIHWEVWGGIAYRVDGTLESCD